MMILAKPKMPEKMITVDGMETFYDWDRYNKNIPLDAFLAWCKEKTPKGATNVSIRVDESWEYDDCIVSLELHWKQVVPNPDYERELKKYDTKLKRWKAQCQKS